MPAIPVHPIVMVGQVVVICRLEPPLAYLSVSFNITSRMPTTRMLPLINNKKSDEYLMQKPPKSWNGLAFTCRQGG